MTKRDRIVIAVILAAGVLAAMFFLVLAPKRTESAGLDAKIQEQQQRLSVAQTGTAAARDARASYEHDYAAVASLGQAIPADDNTASLIYQLDKAAKKSRVEFRSLKVEPTPPAAPSATAAAPAPAVEGAAAPAAPAIPVATPVADFPTMPLSFVFSGSFFNFERFLRRIAGFTSLDGKRINVRGRLLSIESVTFAEATKFPAVTATVKATAYILPTAEGLTNGATASGPAAATATAAAPGAGASVPAAPATAALTTTGGSK